MLVLALLSGACGGSQTSAPPPPPPPPPSDAAPGWVQQGDGEIPDGNRFICEGYGDSEEAAMDSANAICDDKICKLCGVEIESVVRTKETLTSVDMERQVVERCRRVRQGENALQRKSTDCGPKGCYAWIQIDYLEETRAKECRRLTDENFADPTVCQDLIEEFKNVEGYTAASFRTRVDLLNRAINACAEIDVRPTPLMQSLGEKLEVGMANTRTGAPRYLRNHWIAPHAPTWSSYRESDKFVERLVLLRDYLQSKIPVLDVIEATYVDEEFFDTDEALATLLEKMKAAPVENGYDTSRVHMLAVDRVEGQAGRGRLLSSTDDINKWMRATYPPQSIKGWSDVRIMSGLFAADKVIDKIEWAYVNEVRERDRDRFMLEVLKVKEHSGRSRIARFEEALAFSLEKRPTERFRAFTFVMPRPDPEFLLAIESKLPKDVYEGLTFDYLQKHLPGFDDAYAPDLFRRFLSRMERSLTEQTLDDRFCIGLYKHLELLEERGGSSKRLSKPICGCLQRQKPANLNSVNTSELYRRALAGSFACVRPK